MQKHNYMQNFTDSYKSKGHEVVLVYLKHLYDDMLKMFYIFTFNTWIKGSIKTVMSAVVTKETKTKKTNMILIIPFESKHKAQGFSVLTCFS